MAKTKNVLFSNVAYRLTVYKAGSFSRFSGLPPALIEKKKRYCYAGYAAFFSLVCGGVPQILRHIVNYL
jgi:hypothetical protein